jgi:hypothetical protein
MHGGPHDLPAPRPAGTNLGHLGARWNMFVQFRGRGARSQGPPLPQAEQFRRKAAIDASSRCAIDAGGSEELRLLRHNVLSRGLEIEGRGEQRAGVG